MLKKVHCSTLFVNGLAYWPLFNCWSWQASTAVNYALIAEKGVE